MLLCKYAEKSNERNKVTKEEIKTFNLHLKFNDIQVSMLRSFVFDFRTRERARESDR
jgi:hypothetical protein